MAARPPPWLQEQMQKYQKSRQDLDVVATQKQHLEAEQRESARTLEELRKVNDDVAVYRFVGEVMIQTKQSEMISEIEERVELGRTRLKVLQKQEKRLVESLKEQEAKITEMMQRGAGSAVPPSRQPPPPSSPQ